MRIAVIWIENRSDYVILVIFEGILHGRSIYMELLYSNILPLRTTEHQRTIADCFGEQLMQADRVDIAVGYVSRASLEEIDRLADELHVAHIVLTIALRCWRSPHSEVFQISRQGLSVLKRESRC